MPSKSTFWFVFITVALLMVAAWAFLPVFVFHSFSDSAKAGQFGDTYGMLNCLFSGAAMIGAVSAVWLQHLDAMAREKEAKQEAARVSDVSRFQILQGLIERQERRLRDLDCADALMRGGYSPSTIRSFIGAYEADLQGLPIQIKAKYDEHKAGPIPGTIWNKPNGLLDDAVELQRRFNRKELGLRELKLLLTYILDFEALYERLKTPSPVEKKAS